MAAEIGNAWDEILKPQFEAEYYKNLRNFLAAEYRQKTIYPDKADVLNAFRYTPPEKVKVVILGQDPYINAGQAHGLALSVPYGVAIPPSLRNMFIELEKDIGCRAPKSGCLIPWALQGVLLLNTVLTVETGKSNSHAGKGWETFTDAVISYLGNLPHPIVFLLWGRAAQSKEKLINNRAHCVLKAPHPSPLSANSGFFGSKPYSRTNLFLRYNNIVEINWLLD